MPKLPKYLSELHGAQLNELINNKTKSIIFSCAIN